LPTYPYFFKLINLNFKMSSEDKDEEEKGPISKGEQIFAMKSQET
jgi:hypothetical protein